MPGPFVVTDYEHAIKAEVTFNTDPGPPVGADFARFKTRFPFKRDKSRKDRDGDSDKSATVVTVQGGRERSTWELEGDLIPSGNATTPTPPDVDPILEAHYGVKTVCTAHTTTAAGSAGTSIVLTPGGGAASGIPVGGGVHIAVDVSAAFGYEVRRVISRSTDTLTIDRAFSTDPATGRTVKVCAASYKFSKAVEKTLHGYTWLNGDNFRQKAGGLIAQMLELSLNGGDDVPIVSFKASGPGAQIAPHTTAKPAPALAGEPLAPVEAKVWFGANKHCLTEMTFTSDNSLEHRESEFCTLFPTGTKRTKNNGRFMVNLDIGFLLTTGTIEGYWDVADALTVYDVLIQIGITPGAILAISIPKYVLDAEIGEVEGEVAINCSGRGYGTSLGDDEVLVSII
jgi:hypothetical protein